MTEASYNADSSDPLTRLLGILFNPDYVRAVVPVVTEYVLEERKALAFPLPRVVGIILQYLLDEHEANATLMPGAE